MTATARFRCPVCNFAVFNRRLAACESCGAALPASYLFTPQDIASIESEHAQNDKLRQDMAREAEALEAQRRKRWESDGA